MSEEIQNALKAVQLRNDDRILVAVSDTWPGPAGEGLRLEDVPEIPNCVAAFGPDGRLIDIASKKDKDIKWWQCVGYCRANGVDHVSIHYDGAGDSAPADLLEKGKYVAIRKASAGPWLVVSSPEIRELRKTNDAVAAAVKTALEKRAAERAETTTEVE